MKLRPPLALKVRRHQHEEVRGARAQRARDGRALLGAARAEPLRRRRPVARADAPLSGLKLRPPLPPSRYEIREATARQEALVESLNATIAAGETLQKELDAHASSQQSVYSFQLTVLGCVLSVLGFCSISIDALSLLHEMDALSLLKMLR